AGETCCLASRYLAAHTCYRYKINTAAGSIYLYVSPSVQVYPLACFQLKHHGEATTLSLTISSRHLACVQRACLLATCIPHRGYCLGVEADLTCLLCFRHVVGTT